MIAVMHRCLAALVILKLSGCAVSQSVHDLTLEGVRLPEAEERRRVREHPYSRGTDVGLVILLSTNHDLRRENQRHQSAAQLTVAMCQGRTHLLDADPRGPLLDEGGLWDEFGDLAVPAPRDSAAVRRDGRYRYWIPVSMTTRRGEFRNGGTGALMSFFPDHDLRHDRGDICVYARGAAMFVGIWRTNTVVVPAAAIRAALEQAPARR